MMKVALYIRVSTEEQHLHGLSLEAQRSALTEYARNHSMQIVDIYEDAGITARKKLENRKEFQRLMQDVKEDKIDLILVTKLDRWFRNIRDYHNTQEVLEKHNCNWRTIFEDYDTSTSGGRLHINIMLSVNQDECDRTSERIKAVFKHKIEKGEIISGSAPLGYKTKNKKMIKDKQKEEMVLDMLEYFELHQSKRGTVAYIRDKYGYNMCHDAFKRLLANPLYKGQYKENKSFCEPYMSVERWNNIQRIAKQNIKKRDTGRIFVYSGLLECAECKHSLTGNYRRDSRGGYEYYRYLCNQHYQRKRCTHKMTINEKKIDKFIADNLQDQLKDYVATYEIKQKTVDYDKQRNAIQKKIKRLKDLYINELIDLEEYKTDLESYNKQLEQIPAETNKKHDLSHVKALLDKNINELYLSLNSEQKQVLIRSVVKKITIDQQSNMTIEFL